jgi:TnpA family transposase
MLLIYGGHKMNISDNSREIIIKEINYVVNKMEECSSMEEKLYYFSGVYSIVQRIFNLEYDSDLVYAHSILLQTYNLFQQRLEAVKAKQLLIPLSEEQFKNLTIITKELAKKIAEKKEINNTLKKFVILSYTTTGNGYYLLQKGLLKI